MNKKSRQEIYSGEGIRFIFKKGHLISIIFFTFLNSPAVTW